MNEDVYTLVYFQPSAEGYDYTYGFIRSDDEVSVNVFKSAKEAAQFIAEANAKIYKNGLNKPSHQYISIPEYSYSLLINGHTSETIYSNEEWTDDIRERYECFMEKLELFNTTYSNIYRDLKTTYKSDKEYSQLLEKKKERQKAEEQRFAEYLKLKGEFDK